MIRCYVDQHTHGIYTMDRQPCFLRHLLFLRYGWPTHAPAHYELLLLWAPMLVANIASLVDNIHLLPPRRRRDGDSIRHVLNRGAFAYRSGGPADQKWPK